MESPLQMESTDRHRKAGLEPILLHLKRQWPHPCLQLPTQSSSYQIIKLCNLPTLFMIK